MISSLSIATNGLLCTGPNPLAIATNGLLCPMQVVIDVLDPAIDIVAFLLSTRSEAFVHYANLDRRAFTMGNDVSGEVFVSESLNEPSIILNNPPAFQQVAMGEETEANAFVLHDTEKTGYFAEATEKEIDMYVAGAFNA